MLRNMVQDRALKRIDRADGTTQYSHGFIFGPHWQEWGIGWLIACFYAQKSINVWLLIQQSLALHLTEMDHSSSTFFETTEILSVILYVRFPTESGMLLIQHLEEPIPVYQACNHQPRCLVRISDFMRLIIRITA